MYRIFCESYQNFRNSFDENNYRINILTSQNSNLSKLDINKFNKQYPTLKVAITKKFHDIFIVIN